MKRVKPLGRPVPLDAKRSAIMGRIRGKGNRTTELRAVQAFRAAHIKGWRRHVALPGTPDFAFPEKKIAVFIDGCFWHGCRKCCRAPKHNAAFWKEKIERNRKRDKRVAARLRARGWRVFRIWEHKLRFPHKVVKRLQVALEIAGG